VSPLALAELRHMMAAPTDAPDPNAPPQSEAAVQARARLRASKQGNRLWRNNVGAGHVEGGAFLRWGLANDSAQINAVVKSADLIGIRKVLITPEHVGQVIGQFWSVECKAVGWRYTGDAHELAQVNWATLVTSLGGHAEFVVS
jgi:hypothetical protein